MGESLPSPAAVYGLHVESLAVVSILKLAASGQQGHYSGRKLAILRHVPTAALDNCYDEIIRSLIDVGAIMMFKGIVFRQYCAFVILLVVK